MRTPLDNVKTFTRYENGDKIVDNKNYICYKFNNSFKVWFAKAERGVYSILFAGKVKDHRVWKSISKKDFNPYGFSGFCWNIYDNINDIEYSFGEEDIIDIN